MVFPTLEELLSEYESTLGAEAPEAGELRRFREFLLRYGGLKRLEPPDGRARLAVRGNALRCFHFSQYLDWYLIEKEGVALRNLEGARVALIRFNEWLSKKQVISPDELEENRASILGGAEGPPVFQDVGEASGGVAGRDNPLQEVREEQDFHVPGEYSALVSGEFVLTKVQEGILYGIREGESKETGPILADRSVSGGSRVGDRVHLSLGKAGDHWNLLSIGWRS